jgi:hypothetical protein
MGSSMQYRGKIREFLVAIATLLAFASQSVAATPDMVSEFGRTCAASRSSNDLKAALAKDGWNAFASVADSHLEREIASVTPMLEAQGLASDYVIYGRDAEGHHLELALSKTKAPVGEDRRLVGCSLYDFSAATPVDTATLGSLAPKITGQKGKLGDLQFETWADAFGAGSEMRAVFVPAASPMRAQLGFTGMMLGTHFLDAAR